MGRQSNRELEHRFLVRIVRHTLGRNSRTCSNVVLDELERWLDITSRRNMFPVIRSVLQQMESDGELISELEPPPGQGIARRWYSRVD